MTISDFLTTGADLLRSAVCSHSGRSRGNVGGRHGFSARIAAAAIFALAATAILPANNAMAQIAGATYTFTSNDDETLTRGGSVTFNLHFGGYDEINTSRWLGADVFMGRLPNADNPPDNPPDLDPISNRTTLQVNTRDFTIEFADGVNNANCLTVPLPDVGGSHSCAFFLTQGSGTFKVMVPIAEHRVGGLLGGPNGLTVPLVVTANTNREADPPAVLARTVLLGDTTFTSGTAQHYSHTNTDGSPNTASNAFRDTGIATSNSTVTYTIAEPTATVARTSSNTIPAATGESRTFTVEIDNVPATVTNDDDVRRVRLTMDFLGTSISSGTIRLNENANGVVSGACSSAATECGWLVPGQYSIFLPSGTVTPRITSTGAGTENRISLDVPVPAGGLATQTVTFTLNTITTVPTVDETLTPTLTGFALYTEDGITELRDISLTNVPSEDLSATFTFRDASSDSTNTKLDESISTIGGRPITIDDESDPTDSTGTASIPGSLTADSRIAMVSVTALAPGTTVTSITTTRDPDGATVFTTTAEGTEPGAFTAEIQGLVPGQYTVQINTEAVDETERRYNIALNVSGVGITRADTEDLLESNTVGVDVRTFTISLAGIDTSDDVTGVRMSLQFPAGRGGFVVDGGNPLLWRSDLFELTFPDTVGTISAANDIITFVASTSGTSEVDIDIRAIFGMPELRGVHTISIVDPAALTGDRNVFRVNASNVSQGSVIARPSAVEFTVAQGTSPVVEILPTDLVAREGDSANKGTLTINLANIADTGTDVVIPYALAANSNSDLTADLGIGEDYTVELVGATFTASGNAITAAATNDSITVAHADINNTTRRASFTFAVTALEDDEVEDEGRETVILTLGPADTITPVGIGLDPTNGTRTIAIADNDFADVCFRNAAVQTAILGALTSIDDCAVVTAANINSIGDGFTVDDADGRLDIASAGGNLNAGDLDDLTNVKVLDLRNNSLTNFSTDLFRDMDLLERILAHGGNDLGRLVVGTFNGLDSIERLTLTSNANLSFADNALDSVLDTLERLTIPGGLKRWANFGEASAVIAGTGTVNIPIKLETTAAGGTDGTLPVAVFVPVSLASEDDATGVNLPMVDVNGIDTAGVVIPAGTVGSVDLTVTTTSAATDERTLRIGVPNLPENDPIAGGPEDLLVGTYDGTTFIRAPHVDGDVENANIVHRHLVDEGTAQVEAALEVGPAATLTRGRGDISFGGVASSFSTFSVVLSDIPEDVTGTPVGAVGVQVSFGDSTNDASGADPLTALDVTLTGAQASDDLITTYGGANDGTVTFFMDRTSTGTGFPGGTDTLTVTVAAKATASENDVVVVNVDSVSLYESAVRSVLEGTPTALDTISRIQPTEVADRTFTIGAPHPTMVVSFLESADPIDEAGTISSTLTLTLDADVLMVGGLSFPYEIDGTDITAADINLASLTGNITVAQGSRTGTLDITGANEGGGDEGSEIMTIMLLNTVEDPLPDNAAGQPLTSSVAAPQITITELPAPTFELVNQRVPRIEIGGDPGEITLRISNFVFPVGPGSADTDVFVIGVAVNAGVDHNGVSVNHGFRVERITTNGAQVLTGTDLSVRLTNPASLDLLEGSTDLSGVYQPYIINQNNSFFRVVLPRALFDNGEGTVTGIGNEDVTFQIVPGGRTGTGAVPQTFNVRVGSSTSSTTTNGAVYDSIDGGSLSGRTRRTPPGEFRAGDGTGFPFTIVRASDAAQLPRMMNPAEQDIMIADTTLITVALPPGIDAPADAAMAVIRMTASSDDGTVTLSEENDSVSNTNVTQLDFTLPEMTSGRSRNFRATVPAPAGIRVRDPEVVSIVCVNPGTLCTGTDVNLKVAVSGGQRLSGDIGIHIEAQSGLNDGDDLTLTATSISFLDSDGEPTGTVRTLGEAPVIPGLTAKVTALTAARTNVLSELTVGGNTVYLSALDDDTGDDDTGAGNVAMGFVAQTANVPVVITLGASADSSTVSGLTVDAATPAIGTDSPRTVMVSGFTPGMNTLTILVDDVDGSEPDRTYTISVFVADALPAADDSSLRSATVDGELVPNFGFDRVNNNNRLSGAIPIPNTDTTAIVAASTNVNARVIVCTFPATGASVPLATGTGVVTVDAAPVGSAPAVDTTTRFRILVAAVADTAPLDCTSDTRGTVTPHVLTVTVEELPDIATLGALTLDGVDLPIITGTGNNVTVALPAGTVGGDLVITATDDGARISLLASTNITLTNPMQGADLNDHTAMATLADLDNDDTITFTITSERGAPDAIAYTLNFVVQDALLENVRFGGTSGTPGTGTALSNLVATGSGTNLRGTASGTLPAGTSSYLELELADPQDTIVMVTGTNELSRDPNDPGRNLSGFVTTERTDPDDYNFTLGNLTVGTNTLMVTVRPENAGMDTPDRIYTITLYVPAASPSASASIELVGRSVLQAGRAAGSDPAMDPAVDGPDRVVGIFLQGFNTTGRPGGTVTSARMIINFGGNDFARESPTVFRNNRFKVTFPPSIESDSDEIEMNHGGAGRIRFRTNFLGGFDSGFTESGSIYIPITINPVRNAGAGVPYTTMTTPQMIAFVGTNVDTGVEAIRTGTLDTSESVALAAIDPSSFMYTVSTAARSAATISPGTDSIDEGDSRELTVSVSAGIGASESTGDATVTFDVTSTVANAHTVSIAPASGVTLSAMSVDGDQGGGSFTLDGGDGDVIIRVASIADSISAVQSPATVTVTLTGLSYDGTDPNPITTNGGFPGTDDTESVLTIVNRTASTLAASGGLTVASIASDGGGSTFTAIGVDGYVGANGGGDRVEVYLPNDVVSGDRIDFAVTVTDDSTDDDDGAYIRICEGTTTSLGTDLGTGTVGVSGFTAAERMIDIHVTSASRVAGEPANCAAAAADGRTGLTTETYTFNVRAASKAGTATLGSTSPPDVVEIVGTARIPLILSDFPEQVRVGTSLVDLEAVNVSFSTANIGTSPSSVDSDNPVIRYPGLYTITPSADTGAVTATVIPNTAFNLRVPVTNGGATVSLEIDALDVANGLLPASITFQPRPAGYSYEPVRGATDDSPLDSSLTNSDSGFVAFTITAAGEPRAEVSIAGTSTNIPEASNTGLVFNISLTGLDNNNDVVIPFTLDGDATYGACTTLTDGVCTAGMNPATADYFITGGTNTAVGGLTATDLDGTLTITGNNAVTGIGTGSFSIIARDDMLTAGDEGSESLVLELKKMAGSGGNIHNAAPTDLTIGDPTTFNLEIVEDASVNPINDITVNEGGAVGNVIVGINRGPIPDTSTATVTFTVTHGGTDGAMADNNDYTITHDGRDVSNGGTLTIAGAVGATPAETTATLIFTATDDTEIDPRETVAIAVTRVQFSDLSEENANQNTLLASVTGISSTVTIGDNDAGATLGAVSSTTLNELDDTITSSFNVVISSAPTTGELTTIELMLGGTAAYGTVAAPHDYRITVTDGTLGDEPTAGDIGGTLTATVTPDSEGMAIVQFTVMVVNDSVAGEMNETIIIQLSSVTDTAATDFEEVNPAVSERTINLTDDDVVVRASLSGDISIGEKAQGEGVITLNLGGYISSLGATTVSFSISNPAGDPDATPDPIPTLISGPDNPADYTLEIRETVDTGALRATGNEITVSRGTSTATFTFTAIDDDRREGNEVVALTITGLTFSLRSDLNSSSSVSGATAAVTITEVSGEDVMRETQMITHVVGKEQVNLVTGLVRQRVSALTLGSPQGFSEPGVQLALAENPQTIQDFFSQMALESSGEMDDGGAFAIWAKGQYIEISGSPDVAGQDNFEYEGKIAGIGMGMEKRFSQSLVGLSMNFSTADIDSKSDMRAEGNYKETMTFFAPYAAWKPDNSRLTLWGTAGAGFGSAEITGGEDHGEGNPSVQAFFAQGGVDLSENLGKTAEVVFGLSAVAIEKSIDAWSAGALNVPGTESSVFQAQADATAYFPVYSDDGQVLRPYVGLASVHDIGDVTNDDRHAMEVQTGIAWSNGPWQVSFDTFYQFLRDDEEAWGVFGEAQWSGTGDLDGLLMGVTSGHGTASSMSDAASSTDSVNSDIDTNLANADTETAEWSVQTNSEYGFAAPVVDRNGRATPFFRSTHSADAQSFVSGVRMDVTDNIGVTAESNRHIPADDDPYSEHAVGLEARWEF